MYHIVLQHPLRDPRGHSQIQEHEPVDSTRAATLIPSSSLPHHEVGPPASSSSMPYGSPIMRDVQSVVHHLLEHCALHTVAFTCGFQCSSQQHHHQPVDSAWPEPASPVARHPGSSHISSSTLGTSSSAAQSYGSALAIRYARASIRIAMYYGIMPKLWMMHSSSSASATL